jgi:hypothetical protein
MRGAFLRDKPRSATEQLAAAATQVATMIEQVDKLLVPAATAGNTRQDARLPSGAQVPVEVVPGDPAVLGVVDENGKVSAYMVPRPYYALDADAKAKLRSEASELRQVVDNPHSLFVDRTRADTRLQEVERLLGERQSSHPLSRRNA